MKENKGKQLLKILQENYEIESAQDLSGAIKDLFKDSLQEMMNAEFETSMGYSKYDKKTEKTNYRNGSSKKKLKSEFGEFDFETPRDRNNEFEPVIVPKNKRDVSGIENKIISLYGRGLSTREIHDQIQDLYGIDVSATMVSNITDQILPKIKEWQERPLEEVYPIVFIDALHFSVRQDNTIIKKAAYIVLGVNSIGEKDVLGIWIGENESAKFWLSVFNDLKQRGVKDILIMCSDGLAGIKEAITAAFPNTVQQRCVVHMIRNSVRFIYYKDLKEFCNDLKTVYTAKNEKTGYEQLQKIKEKWKTKYPTSLKNWEENWDLICPFFNYSDPVRKIMYTTNTIESLNRTYRKYTKTKSVFPSDESLMKCLYLATQNITKKWTGRYRDWDRILGELSIMFEGRI
ncbi:MAG: IS256 family transposase [Bacilli bacterium]|nr:IS256 family transposase [Bacilli bacterium]MDD3305450.1 IS256 family transposase [Bacilli bacterium]MDD4400088.1 IS256 family transposase [Dysgonamonadaceae bacterium]